MNSDNPTTKAYGELQNAYDFFNAKLFQDRLPPCLITLSRKHVKALGYFIHKRFAQIADSGATTDEICMNPQYVKDRPMMDTLSTLVHEMTHLEQAHFGKKPRGGYHDKAWGELMKKVGLHPSDTGQEGGKETGQRMTHYVVSGGKFDEAAKALVDGGFAITWADGAVDGKKSAKAGKRTKYCCPRCESAVWGKADMNITCSDCDVDFLQEES